MLLVAEGEPCTANRKMEPMRAVREFAIRPQGLDERRARDGRSRVTHEILQQRATPGAAGAFPPAVARRKCKRSEAPELQDFGNARLLHLQAPVRFVAL